MLYLVFVAQVFTETREVRSARCSVPSWCDALVSLRSFKKFAVLYERR